MPNPVDFPIYLKSEHGNNIGPGADLSFALFWLVRASNMPVIKIEGNGKNYRWFEANARAWNGKTPVFEPYRFTVEVSAENHKPARWEVDLEFITDRRRSL